MVIDVQNLPNGIKKEFSFKETLKIPSEYKLTTQNVLVKLNGEVLKEGENCLISGKGIFYFKYACDRCLDLFNIEIPFEFFEKYSHKVDFFDEEIEIWNFSENLIEIEEALIMNFASNYPMKKICNENCKGLCSVCGSNNNISECSCDTLIKDSRFAKLYSLFENNKEV